MNNPMEAFGQTREYLTGTGRFAPGSGAFLPGTYYTPKYQLAAGENAMTEDDSDPFSVSTTKLSAEDKQKTESAKEDEDEEGKTSPKKREIKSKKRSTKKRPVFDIRPQETDTPNEDDIVGFLDEMSDGLRKVKYIKDMRQPIGAGQKLLTTPYPQTDDDY